MRAANAPDRQFQLEYQFVDLNDVDFTADKPDVPWAEDSFFMIKKIGRVTAVPAQENEVVDMVYDNNFKHKEVARAGDWKVTSTSGKDYILSDEVFRRSYLPIPGNGNRFIARADLPERKAFQLRENVKFMSPNGDTNYIPAGGWIVDGSRGAYGIHVENIKDNYTRTCWVGRVQDGAENVPQLPG